jgi:hypothetical protein
MSALEDTRAGLGLSADVTVLRTGLQIPRGASTSTNGATSGRRSVASPARRVGGSPTGCSTANGNTASDTKRLSRSQDSTTRRSRTTSTSPASSHSSAVARRPFDLPSPRGRGSPAGRSGRLARPSRAQQVVAEGACRSHPIIETFTRAGNS